MKTDSSPKTELSAPETDSSVSSERSAIAIRGGAVRVIGYVAGVLVSLGSATILVRDLGIATFGRFVTVTSLVALVGGVTEAGIYVYGIREFDARSEPDRRHLLANLLTMRLVLTVIGVAGAACFGLAAGYREALVLGILVAGAGLLVQVNADVLSISLQAQLQLGRLTAVELSRRLLTLLLIGLLALLGAGVLPFLAASTVSGALALALLAWIVRSSITIRLNMDWRAWRELFAETLPLALASSIGAIYFYVTVIIMSLIAPAGQTGLFATSFRITQVALGVPILLMTAIFPLMARAHAAHEPETGETVGKVFTVAVICGVWMSLAMAIGAPFIIDVVAGTQARGAVVVLQIQASVFIASFISTSSGLALVSLHRYRAMMLASTSALVLNVVLGLWLVPALGARGGALADVITEAVVSIGLTAALIRAVPRHQISSSVALPLVLATGLSATVLFLPVDPVTRVIVATIIYFAVLLLIGAIPTEVTQAARRMRMQRTPP
jgi:O-antigen/teichoic acid export membrane protein